jgi:hypothetical protein
MKKILTLYIFLAWCLVPAPVPLFATSLDAGFLYFKILDMKKEMNGQVSQAIELICTDPAAGAVNVLYQEDQNPTVFWAPVTNGVVTLFADKPSRIRLFAFALNQAFPKTLVAHTNLVLFGKSSTPAPRDVADDLHANLFTKLPTIQLISPEHYYWHQTGQPLQFRIQSPPALVSTDPSPQLPAVRSVPQMAVLENHVIRSLKLNSSLEFSHTPPHDQGLRKAGAIAIRQDILYTPMMDKTMECALTYTLVLHRSRHGFNNPIAGALVCGASLILFTGLILKKRRTPWWKT